jgi:hypothetical protein
LRLEMVSIHTAGDEKTQNRDFSHLVRMGSRR